MRYNFRETWDKLIHYIPNIVDKLVEDSIVINNVIVSTDSRKCSNTLKEVLLNSIPGHIEIYDLGIASTPCASFIARKYNIPAIQITASHCASDMGGLKIFYASGHSLKYNYEKLLISSLVKTTYKPVKKLNQKKYKLGKDEYFKILKSLWMYNLDKQNICWIIYKNSRNFLKFVCDSTTIFESEEPDPEKRSIYKYNISNYKFAINLDADADKCSIYHYGKRLNESKIIATLAMSKLVKFDCLITNHEFSIDIETFLKKRNIQIKSVCVGDHNISPYLFSNETTYFAAEPNGHYILPNMLIADGIMSALTFINDFELYSKLPLITQLKSYFSYTNKELLCKELTKYCKESVVIYKDRSFMMKLQNNVTCILRHDNWESSVIAIYEGEHSMNERLFFSGIENRITNYINE